MQKKTYTCAKKCAILFSLTALMLFCHVASALPSPKVDLLNKLLQIENFQAEYTQMMDENDKSTGKLFFLRPQSLRLDTLEPITSSLVIEKNQLKIFEPDIEQLTIKPYSIDNRELPINLVFKPKENFQHYTISVKHKQNKDTYTLQDKNSNTSYKITFEKDILKSFSIKYSEEQKISMFFHNQKQNQKLNSDIFKLNVSKETDIIQG